MSVEPLEDRRLLATLTVTNLNDDGAGSLRRAIQLANNNGEPDTIDIGVTGTITLSSGPLLITDDLTINGPGAENVIIDANGTSSVFDIDDGDNANHADVNLHGLTITGGVGVSDGFGAAGGVYSRENLVLSRCVVTGNEASGSRAGGGLAVFAHAGSSTTISSSTITGNSGPAGGMRASLYGGNIAISESTISDNSSSGIQVRFDYTGGDISIHDSSITGNSNRGISAFAGGYGSGRGNLTITSSSISGNTASFRGGGFDVFGSLVNVDVTNSTFSGNRAEKGGAIYSSSTPITISHSTITGNTADSGGGVFVSSSAELTLDHSIVSGNEMLAGAGPDIYQLGTVTASYTLIGDNSGTFLAEGSPDTNGNIIGGGIGGTIDAMLGPLQFNGGETRTHNLLPGSPAIDAGDPAFSGPPDFDQRECPLCALLTDASIWAPWKASPSRWSSIHWLMRVMELQLPAIFRFAKPLRWRPVLMQEVSRSIRASPDRQSCSSWASWTLSHRSPSKLPSVG